MKPTQSIRWQMQFWYALLLAAALSGFGTIAYHQQRGNRIKQIDLSLEREMTAIVARLRSELRQPRDGGDGASPPSVMRGRTIAEFSDSAVAKMLLNDNGLDEDYIVLWGRLGTELGRLGAAPDDVPFPGDTGEQGAYNVQRSRGEYREVYRFLGPGDCVLLGKSIRPDSQQWRRLAWQLAGSGVGVLVVGLLGGWFFLSRAIRPVRSISEAAREYAGGKLDTRIPEARSCGELEQLSEDLNETFDQLEKAFARQSRFTADAAHELRTPVSVILSQTQAALAREREPQAYRDALAGCERGAQRLRRLIDSLLALTSLDSAEDGGRGEAIDLSAVARECVDFMGPLLKEHGLSVVPELEPAPCLGSPDRLGQVFVNLIANAIQFSEPGDPIRVSTGRDGDDVWAKVVDSGRGIAEEHLPYLFERFYRADASRNRAAGGAGLGLAICHEVVKAHGGSIGVESEVDVGTTFTVKIPAGG